MPVKLEKTSPGMETRRTLARGRIATLTGDEVTILSRVVVWDRTLCLSKISGGNLAFLLNL
jgi:hypothetical protein